MKNGVVIVTYNRLELLRECLACVKGQTFPFSDVIVIDNCSTDGTEEYLDQMKDTWDPSLGRIHVIHEETNLGGSGGFYHGLQVAEEKDLDWVLIIDDDAMIAPDYMEILMSYGADRPQVHALAGGVITEGKLDISHRRRIVNKLLFAEQSVPREAYEEEAFSCDAATFCGLVIRGETLRKIGLPKKEYFIWYDDTEFCLRLMPYHGITVVPKALLNHKTTPAPETMVVKGVLHRIGWRQYYGYRNRYDTAYEHLGRLTACCILWQYRAFLLASCLMLCNRDDREQARYNIRLLRDVLRDCRKHTLGYHSDYHR